MRRTALTDDDTKLFRQVFREIIEAHYEHIWVVLLWKGVRPADTEDLAQEAFVTFYRKVVAEGFPDSISGMSTSIAIGKALNQLRGEHRSPITLGLPSSGMEPPKSTLGPERRVDLHAFIERFLPVLSEDCSRTRSTLSWCAS